MKSCQEINVCVIGAGVCGLVSTKICLESGFKVTCFDKSPTYGGLWRYRDSQKDVREGFIPSVMRTTILNTSKELSAFSDFPPPAQLPNFMKHSLYMDYISSYVEHFTLLPHLKLQHEVLKCEPECNPDGRGIKWSVDIKDLHTNKTSRIKFDKLIVSIGHHNLPYAPTFKDQPKFKGQIVHSAHVKDIINDERFIDKRVVVVGFGNSACDAANDIAIVAKKCFVASHRGQWFINRVSTKGPYDFEITNRLNYLLSKHLPSKFKNYMMIKRAKDRTNHQMLGLTPKHVPSEQVPAINDLLPYRIFTGGITLKGSLERFTEKGVMFEGEECEYEVDVVVMATGYQAQVAFLDEVKMGIKSIDQYYELYLNIFAPKLSIPSLEDRVSPMEIIKSLAFIGLVQPGGSITVISELQARFVAQVFANKCKLPEVDKMIQHIAVMRAKRSMLIRSHSKDQILSSWIGYLDVLARGIGVKPRMSKIFFEDFTLWKQLMFGPSVPYQYRLFGPGKWDGARETILAVNQRVYSGINDGKNHILFKSRHKSLKDSLG